MAPHLRPEVISAIETAIEMNDGELESAFIHSLAKIYKTSPQAVVWNMKRYNKVKAGKDDRKKHGRKPAMEKEKAAEVARQILQTEWDPKYDKISDALLKEFGIRVSVTWVSRLVKDFAIPVMRRPATESTRAPKKRKRREDRPSEEQKEQDVSQASSATTHAQYPSFRQDLDQAVVCSPFSQSSDSPLGVHSNGRYHAQPLVQPASAPSLIHELKRSDSKPLVVEEQQMRIETVTPLTTSSRGPGLETPISAETRTLPPPTPSASAPASITLPPVPKPRVVPPPQKFIWKPVRTVDIPGR
ncbi:hypothetical protein BP6252_00599 [Coleophoma cylindrospora]|uniref:Uncharacterized protein n=1 Tax=Coleophoma cylindrospora TaxID=1849047 RepID=A0A3D8SQJ8_9HELO|nr:hypothetical protein BP6252_00599 [Coleophoma cylindrospora]